MLRVLFDGFSLVIPPGWSDVLDETSYSEASQAPRQRFAPAIGRGELLIGRIATRPDEMPGADARELEDMARAWGVHRGVAKPLACASVVRRDGVLTTASFQLGREFVEVSYLANGAALIEISYLCAWGEREVDRAGREALVASLRFA